MPKFRLQKREKRPLMHTKKYEETGKKHKRSETLVYLGVTSWKKKEKDDYEAIRISDHAAFI